MDDVARAARNKARLEECHPWFRDRLVLVLRDLEADGFKPRIQDAWRSPIDQEKAFKAGNSKLLYGFHNVTGPNGEKEAFAADILREDDTILVSEKEYCIALAHHAIKYCLSTGIRWGVPKGAMDKALHAAIKAKDLTANVRIGWDPTHIQTSVIGLSALKRGERPNV